MEDLLSHFLGFYKSTLEKKKKKAVQAPCLIFSRVTGFYKCNNQDSAREVQNPVVVQDRRLGASAVPKPGEFLESPSRKPGKVILISGKPSAAATGQINSVAKGSLGVN